MALHGAIGIDQDHHSVRFESFPQIPQKLIRVGDLMIHVDEENPVERAFWKHRIRGLAELYRNIVQAFALDPLGKSIARLGNDVFGQDTTPPADQRRQANGVIAFACADVGNGKPRADLRKSHDFLGFADPIASIFGREAFADDWSDIASGLGEGLPGRLRTATGKAKQDRGDE